MSEKKNWNTETTDMAVTSGFAGLAGTDALGDVAEDLAGLQLTFDRIRIPACGSTGYGAKVRIDGDFGLETKASCRVVAKGDKGLLVSTLQVALLVHGITCTKIDASFGNQTEKGVKEFQNTIGITVDGIAGPQTFEELLC